MLTLANGDRILMTPQMKAFFEPENLANASPATVSRAGIIYVSDVELGWGPLAASWLQGRRPAEAALLQPCFDKFVGRALDFVRRAAPRLFLFLLHALTHWQPVSFGSLCELTLCGSAWWRQVRGRPEGAALAGRRLNLKPVLHNEVVCQVGTLLTLLDGTLGKTAGAGTAGGGGDAGAAVAMERVFLFCLVWSLGGLLDSKDRAAFDLELRTQTHLLPKKARAPRRRAGAPPRASLQPGASTLPEQEDLERCVDHSNGIRIGVAMAHRFRGPGPGRRGRHGLRVSGHGGPRRLAALAGARALLEVPPCAGMRAGLPGAQPCLTDVRVRS